MAFDGVLKFATAIDQSGFKKGLDNIGSIASKGMALVTSAVTAASGAVAALGGYAINVGSSFESSMAQVIATMGITKDTVEDGVNSYELLKEAAAAAGESTTFSASEAASALNYLALAGYDAATAADALPAVLDLAAAGGMDLAYASDLATDAMAALGIEATSTNLTRFGDEMALTASKANTSVSQLGEAILTVGGTAKVLAGGTTELNAALGVLANRGIKGAEGGTHLRNMILSLSAPTDTAKAALDNLGVSALDADGNMRPLNETFADLDKALSGMSDGEKAEILSQIFNKTDLAAAQGLLAGCGQEFDDLTTALSECDGAMSQMAETMNDTLEGDIKSLQSKAEAFGIAIYEDMNLPLRDLAQTGGEYLSQLTAAFKEGGFEGLAESAGDVLSQAITKITSYLPELADIGASIVISLADGLIDNAGSITESAMSIIGTLVTTFGELMPKLAELAVKAISEFAKGLSTNISQIKSTAKQMIQSFADMLKNNLPELIQSAVSIIVSLAEVLADNADIILDAILSTIEVLARSLIENIDPLIDAAVQIIISLADYISNNADEMTRVTIEIIEAVARCFIENAPKLLAAALILLGSLVAAVPQILEELLNELGEVGADVLLWLDDVCGDALLAVGSWLSDISDSAVQGAKDAVSGFIEFFDELPDDIADTLKNALDKVGSWATDMNNKASETGRDFLNGVADFFTRLPRQIKEKLDDTLNKVVTWGIDLASAGKTAAGDLFDAIVDKIKSLPSELRRIGQELVEGLWKGIDEAADWLDDKMSGFADGVVDGVKGFFGIASPSKVMRDQVGIYLAQGIEEGFVREIPETGKAALEALQGLEVLKPEVKLPAIKIDLDDPDRNDSPSFAPGALRIMSAQTTDISSISQPSPTSDIVNNYSYSTVNNTTAAEAAGSQPVNIQLVIGEEIIAEGFVDIASDKLDKAQGQKVVLRKRGLA